MQISINDLVYSGHHGVFRREKHTPQRFLVSVALDLFEKPHKDSIKETIDYSVVKERVRKVIEEESHNLIETIVERIATGVLSDARVKTIEVSVTKLDVWENGKPSVKECFTRSE
jgi:dihydroneopterin aldolase